MKEYKFRAWDRYHQEMIDWEQYKDELVSNDLIEHEEGPLVVMQYTGMKDSFGREIYEADIYIDREINKVVGWEETIYQVVFNNGAFKIKGEVETRYMGESYTEGRYYSLDTIQQRKMEHVGNIYENPELLEEE